MRQDTLVNKMLSDVCHETLDSWDDIFKELIITAHDLCFDFNYRTAIHDCLDFDNPTLVIDYRKALIHYIEDLYF
jgi:hypothetical protein